MQYHALVRTHHITSRKKLAALRKAADRLSCFALVKYGRPPGIMYCEGQESSVTQWVDAVHRLRYKDYLLVCRPAHVAGRNSMSVQSGLHEVDDVKQFAARMEHLGMLSWWKSGMGYSSD